MSAVVTGQSVNVAGIPVVPVDVDGAVDLILGDANAHRARVYILVNAHSARLRRTHPAYATALQDVGLCVGLVDGASVEIAARGLGYQDVRRSPGPDVFQSAAARCAREGRSVFLMGGAAGVAQRVAEELQAVSPGLRIAGYASPPFGEWSDETSVELVETIRASAAEVVWLGISAPKQEIWAYRYAAAMGCPVVCVGAAFDFVSGTKSRAPAFMRRVGLEWVHRLLAEPRRMWRRYLVGNSLFLWDVLRYRRSRASVPTAEVTQ